MLQIKKVSRQTSSRDFQTKNGKKTLLPKFRNYLRVILCHHQIYSQIPSCKWLLDLLRDMILVVKKRLYARLRVKSWSWCNARNYVIMSEKQTCAIQVLYNDTLNHMIFFSYNHLKCNNFRSVFIHPGQPNNGNSLK